MNKHPSNVYDQATNKPASNAVAFTLAGTATAPYRAFAAALSNGDTCPVHASNGVDWQDFTGTYSAGTLAQTTLLESSTGSWIDWSAGADVTLEIAWLGAHGEDTDAHLNDASKHLPPSPTLGQMVVQSDAGPVWVNYATVLNNTLAPVVSGSTGYGNVLTCTTGTWAGFGSISYAYQWYNGATILSGETTSTYTTVYGDVGDAITCTVTATDTLTSASANSNAVTVTDSPLELSQFYAPLTNSLILTRGTGNPTYTRATSAWEFDNEGKLITVPSGASRHGGARMVYNLIKGSSEDFTNANWVKSRSSYAGGKLLDSADASSTHRMYQTVTLVNGPTYTGYAEVKAAEYSKVEIQITDYNEANQHRVNFDLVAKTATTASGSPVGSITELEEGWFRCVVTATPTVLAYGFFIGLLNEAGDRFFTGDGTKGVYIRKAQLENVTGQIDQTASEYVSVGVLSATFHGAGVDGVKWFNTNKDGSAISAANLLGYHAEGARTNNLLYSRDLTNAAWVKTNVTATRCTGIDNAANSASTLTAGAANATILQTLTLASAARSSSAYVKRRTGTGTISFTRDGGTTWTDITSLINGSTWTRVKIENTSVTNPSTGIMIATSGDAIDVDVVQDEAGAFISSPIITTTVAVTRNADVLTYQTASNISDTAGAMRSSVQYDVWGNASGIAIGGTNGLALSTSNSGVQAKDGTNTVNGPTGTPSGTELLAICWGSGALKAASGGSLGTAGSYAGGFGLSTIALGAQFGFQKQTHIWQSALTDSELQAVTA